MKKIVLSLSHEEITLLFTVCEWIGKAALSEKMDKKSNTYAVCLLIAEKAIELHKRTYIYTNTKKKARITFRLSEAAALRIHLKSVRFSNDAGWEVNKLNEMVAHFDKQLV